MNVTLSIDERLLKRARQRAEAMGKSLNELIRDFLTDLTDDKAIEAYEQELKSLSAAAGGNRAGWKFDRAEIHERP